MGAELPRFLALLLTPIWRALGYSGCLRCGLSHHFGQYHETRYSDRSACFPLCEHCWRKLATPAARLPYYERLVFGLWSEPSRWQQVRAAVLGGL